MLGGTPIFAGTRVPVRNLIDYLEAGESLDVFLDHLPSVSRKQDCGVRDRTGRAGDFGRGFCLTNHYPGLSRGCSKDTKSPPCHKWDGRA